MVIVECSVCHKLFQAQRRSAKYCSNRCKMAKRNGVPVALFPDEPPDVSAPAAPIECQAAVQELHRLANDFGRLSATAPFQLQAKFARIARAISRALEDEGL